MKKEYLGRGIHNEKFIKSLKLGKLKEMLTIVNNDVDLDVQIRKDYLNIYYKGGNIAKINSEDSVEFDMFYFYLNMKNTPKKEIENKSEIINSLKENRNTLIKKFKAGNYREYFIDAKKAMDKWFKINDKPERMEQHKLAINNTYLESDYTILDLEYQVSTLSEFACSYIPKDNEKPIEPKFDIITINRDGKVCVMELKKGIKALQNKSGLKEHWECYKHSIGKNHQPFIEEMKRVLKQKKELGLIDELLEIKSDVPEFMFAYAYDDKETGEQQDNKFQAEYNKIGENIHTVKLERNSYKIMNN